MQTKIYQMALISDGAERENICYDYLIIAPNIEVRSRAFYKKFCNTENVVSLIILDFENFHKEISREQEKEFYDDFSDRQYHTISCLDGQDAVIQLCKVRIPAGSKIAIDITGFSIPNIYYIMHTMRHKFDIDRIDVYYTEPQFYIYDKGYYDSYHAYLGERQCAPIMGYYSSGEDEKEILTVFLGFDSGLADYVYSKLGEESQDLLDVLVVNGFPSYTMKLKDVSLLNNVDIITKVGAKQIRTASAVNPFATYNLLCRIQEKYEGKLLNICTIGAKPVALGACLFALDNPDNVKVTYPFYEKVKFDAEEKAGKIWRYQIAW